MSRKRSEEQVMNEILHICAEAGDGVDKLRIMNAAFLPDREASAFLTRLVAQGLLQYSENLKRYSITPEGLEFIAR